MNSVTGCVANNFLVTTSGSQPSLTLQHLVRSENFCNTTVGCSGASARP